MTSVTLRQPMLPAKPRSEQRIGIALLVIAVAIGMVALPLIGAAIGFGIVMLLGLRELALLRFGIRWHNPGFYLPLWSEALLLVGWPPALMGVYAWGGRGEVVLVIGSIFAADAGALYGGRRFGRHKVWAKISAGKTWEGFVLGVIFAMVATLMFRPIFNYGFGYGTQAAVVAIIAMSGLAGDLLESAVKRRAHAKDSGTLLRGHGGVLDRIDALLAAGPVAVLLVATHVM